MNAFSIYRITLLLALLLFGPNLIGQTQRVGIGTAQPQETLDVNGAVRIGSTTGLNAGTIRWNPLRNDFEGYNGSAWVSLTGSKGSWGRQEDLVRENDGSTFALYDPVSGEYGRGIGRTFALTPDVIVCGTYEDYSPGGEWAAGSAHVIKKHGSKWDYYPAYEMRSPTPQAGEHYGYAVAATATRAVIGAPGWNDARGRAYVYEILATGEPVYKATFSNGAGSPSDYFGLAVGASGDYVMVGVPNKDVSGNQNQGQVIVYKYIPGNQTWFVAQYLHNPEPAPLAQFGEVIDIDYPYAIIGVPNATAGGHEKAGKVYVYHYNGGWNLQQVLQAPVPGTHGAFGKSVALRSDTLVVGMPQSGAFNDTCTGKVFVFVRNGNTWDLQASIVPEGSPGRIQFGASVDLMEGVLVTGAPSMGLSFESSAGRAFVYAIAGGAWEIQARLSSEYLREDDFFGTKVAIMGNTVVVGAPGHTIGNATDGGRLFYYYRE